MKASIFPLRFVEEQQSLKNAVLLLYIDNFPHEHKKVGRTICHLETMLL